MENREDDLLSNIGHFKDGEGLDDLDVEAEEALLQFSDQEDNLLECQEGVEYVDEEGNPVQLEAGEKVEVVGRIECGSFQAAEDEDVLEVEANDLDIFSLDTTRVSKEEAEVSSSGLAVSGEEDQREEDVAASETTLDDEDEDDDAHNRRNRFRNERQNIINLSKPRKRTHIPDTLESVISEEESAKVTAFMSQQQQQRTKRQPNQNRGPFRPNFRNRRGQFQQRGPPFQRQPVQQQPAQIPPWDHPQHHGGPPPYRGPHQAPPPPMGGELPPHQFQYGPPEGPEECPVPRKILINPHFKGVGVAPPPPHQGVWHEDVSFEQMGQGFPPPGPGLLPDPNHQQFMWTQQPQHPEPYFEAHPQHPPAHPGFRQFEEPPHQQFYQNNAGPLPVQHRGPIMGPPREAPPEQHPHQQGPPQGHMQLQQYQSGNWPPQPPGAPPGQPGPPPPFTPRNFPPLGRESGFVQERFSPVPPQGPPPFVHQPPPNHFPPPHLQQRYSQAPPPGHLHQPNNQYLQTDFLGPPKVRHQQNQPQQGQFNKQRMGAFRRSNAPLSNRNFMQRQQNNNRKTKTMSPGNQQQQHKGNWIGNKRPNMKSPPWQGKPKLEARKSPAFSGNIKEVPIVESLQLDPPKAEEVDEETQELLKKIEEQAKLREAIIRRKEERRRQMATQRLQEVQASKMAANNGVVQAQQALPQPLQSQTFPVKVPLQQQQQQQVAAPLLTLPIEQPRLPVKQRLGQEAPKKVFMVRKQAVLPSNNQPVASRNQPMQARNQPMQARNQPMQARNQMTPVRNQSMQARNQQMQLRNQQMQARTQPMPIRNQPMPIRNQPLQARNINAPVLKTLVPRRLPIPKLGPPIQVPAMPISNLIPGTSGVLKQPLKGVPGPARMPVPVRVTGQPVPSLQPTRGGPGGARTVLPVGRRVIQVVKRSPSQEIAPIANPPALQQPPQQQQRMVKMPLSTSVVISNLSASTSDVQLMKLCRNIGPVESIKIVKAEGKAVVKFKQGVHAVQFQKKFQRFMLDLSMIQVALLQN